MSAQARAQRDASLAKLRSLNAGMVFASVAAIGIASAGVAVAAPGHKAKPTTSNQTVTTPGNSGPAATTDDSGGGDGGGDGGSAVQQPQQQPQQVNPNTNPPVVTSGGS